MVPCARLIREGNYYVGTNTKLSCLRFFFFKFAATRIPLPWGVLWVLLTNFAITLTEYSVQVKLGQFNTKDKTFRHLQK